ncbi:MAG: CHAT domain-containing protein [Candidatus Eisenbacteria bacterium]|uniref:CHAT domain-containing protein n=1 Tax=Eiseniibacteriota bacterium TaxID=2212470 RepID=A0A849SU51_UNCEI|nr:CHAT domain-containing protein [Candidatus Eisenbacteria bacterium]
MSPSPVPHPPSDLASRASRVLSFALALGLAWANPCSALERERFWETWNDLSDLATRSPDSAHAQIQLRLAAEPLDVPALVLRAKLAASDSTAAESLLARTRAETSDVAVNVARGTTLVVLGRSTAGRLAWARARRGYVALGRLSEAAQTAVHEALLDRAGRGDPSDPALAIAESLGLVAREPEIVMCARTLSGTRWQQRDTRRALAVLQQAVALAPATGPCYMGAEAERQLAVAFKSLGKLDSARVHYQRGVAIARGLGRAELNARCLHGLGTTLEAEARVPEAEQIYREALAMMPLDEHRARANLLGQLGKLFLSAKRYDEARAHFAESNLIYDRYAPRAEGHVLNLQHLGQIETSSGDFDAAREHFERAVAESRDFGLPRLQGAILSDLAGLALQSGDDTRAERLFEEALVVERKLGRERFVAHLLCARAGLQLERGRAAVALTEAREAAARLAVAEPAGVPSANALIVRALLELSRIEEAGLVADSAWRFAEARGDSALMASAWELDAEVQLAAGRPQAALAALARALPVARRLNARELMTRLLERQGRALLAAGEPARAIAPFEEAIELQELAQFSLRSGEERSQIQTLWQELYVQLALAYRRAGRGAEAFRVVDRSRARGLRERLEQELPAPRRGAPDAVLREVDAARAALEDAQRRLTAQYALAPADRSAGLRALESRCASLRERFAEAQLRLERAAPGYARTSGLARSLGVADLRRRLGANETMLAYLIGIERGLVFVVTPQTLVVREIDAGEAQLDREVDSLVAALSSGSDDRWREPALRLGAQLVPEAAWIGSGRLLVTADGPLHRLPFEVLRVGTRGSERCLIERRAVVLGASPSLFFDDAPRAASRSPRLAAFGDPDVSPLDQQAMRRGMDRDLAFAVGRLPNARREVQGIARHFPGARTYVGAAATESQVLREIERCQVLHVAAHGFVDARRPRFSGLVLARDSAAAGDGLLQAYEVIARHGDLELVTLSACETGRGTVQRGEGLLGLARAFRIAGARNLLVSLWQVDDAATADFMLAFYDRLARGEPAAEALATVKRAMLAGIEAASASGASRGVTRMAAPAQRRHPAYWAPFVLQGVAGAPRTARAPATPLR